MISDAFSIQYIKAYWKFNEIDYNCNWSINGSFCDVLICKNVFLIIWINYSSLKFWFTKYDFYVIWEQKCFTIYDFWHCLGFSAATGVSTTLLTECQGSCWTHDWTLSLSRMVSMSDLETTWSQTHGPKSNSTISTS